MGKWGAVDSYIAIYQCSKNGGKAGSERDLFVFHRNPASVQQTVYLWTLRIKAFLPVFACLGLLKYPSIFQCLGTVHESTHRLCPRFDG